MSIVDLLIMIIVVTILVTIVLGVITYLAYKLRRSRRPESEVEEAFGTWYFVRHLPERGRAEEV
jgi:heme/copper-type cytochrome/quinol oxidase subunit 2